LKRVALLGFPVGHSRSPAMQNAAFRARGLEWSYEAIAVEPERFEAVLPALPREGFAGANVTVPHKLRALEAADSASAVARVTGAANTLVFSAGRVRADNTDVAGFLRALRERAPDAPAGMRALVLGAGGAARAVVYALLAERAAAVSIWNRTGARAAELAAELGPLAGSSGLAAVAEPSLAGIDLVVNATSFGMAGEAAEGDFKLLPLAADKWEDVHVVADLVYRGGGTPLGRLATAHGRTFVDGIDILVHQGAASFELWTGVAAPLEVMRLAARTREPAPDS
jgi:shikimate dehydrogenase